MPNAANVLRSTGIAPRLVVPASLLFSPDSPRIQAAMPDAVRGAFAGERLNERDKGEKSRLYSGSWMQGLLPTRLEAQSGLKTTRQKQPQQGVGGGREARKTSGARITLYCFPLTEIVTACDNRRQGFQGIFKEFSSILLTFLMVVLVREEIQERAGGFAEDFTGGELPFFWFVNVFKSDTSLHKNMSNCPCVDNLRCKGYNAINKIVKNATKSGRQIKQTDCAKGAGNGEL